MPGCLLTLERRFFMDKKEYAAPTVEVVLFENIGVDLPLSVKSDSFEDPRKK